MDFANRGNRPAQQASQDNSTLPSAPQQPAFQAPMSKNKRKRGLDFSKLGSIFVVGVGALFLVLIILMLVFGGGKNYLEQEREMVNTDLYQAVFLDSQDGQVYFGKLEVVNKDLYKLTDIFYVRVEQPLQPEGTNQQSQANISLAKLGNELHGPEDMMLISRDNVLYWENLKTDGQVSTAIADFIANGRQTPEAPASSQSTDATTQQTTQQSTTPAATQQTTTPVTP